jgi:hypothetical protein
MDEIKITAEEYRQLVKRSMFTDAVMNLLASKKTQNTGIYKDDIELLCVMFGVSAG